MGYSTELTKAPTEVVVGEEFTVELEVCYDGSGPSGQSMDLTLDGETVVPANVPSFETCIPFDGPVTIGTQGEHTLSWPEGFKTITAIEPQFDQSLVDAGCPDVDAPDDPSPGDPVTLTSRLSNANDSPVSATVEIAFGSATQQRTVTIPANGSETATATFTPEEATDYPIDRPEIIDVSEA